MRSKGPVVSLLFLLWRNIEGGHPGKDALLSYVPHGRGVKTQRLQASAGCLDFIVSLEVPGGLVNPSVPLDACGFLAVSLGVGVRPWRLACCNSFTHI